MSSALVEQLTHLISTDPKDPEAVNDAVLKIESLLLGEPSNIASTPHLGSTALNAANRLYETYETNLENSFAAELLRGEVILSDYPLYARFQRLVGKEVALANITPSSRVLFIGSGPFPISPILTHELSGGAKVDCFDLSAEACGTSRKVVEQLGLGDKIQILNITAEDAKLPTISEPGDMGKYDAIIVALLAQPKYEILSKIWRSLPKGSTVVVRNSEGNRRVLYEGMSLSGIPKRYKQNLEAEYHAGVDDTISGSVITTDYQPLIWRI